MAGLPPAQGAGAPSPLLGILSGLAAGAQGFMQGRQMRNEQAMQRQQMELEQQRMELMRQQVQHGLQNDAFTDLDRYKTFAQADPSLAQNPGFVGAVNKAGSAVGVNYGDKLPDTYTQVPFQDLMTKSPQIMEYLQGLPPEQRAGILSRYSGVPDAVKTAPAMVTNPFQQAKFPDMVSKQLDAVGKGQMDPNQFVAWVKTTAPRFGYNPTDLFDPSTIGQLGKAAEAHVADLAAKTGLNQAKLPFVKSLMQSQIKRNLAGADDAQARASTEYMKAQAEVTKANAAAQNANTNAAKVQLQVKAAQQLGGVDPRAAGTLNAAMRNLQSQVNMDRQARDSLNNQWVKLMAIPGANSPGTPDRPNPIAQQIKTLQDQAASITKRLEDEQGQLQQFSSGYKGIVQKEQRALGAPNSWKPTSVEQNATWSNGSGKPVKVTSKDGGLTWTPDGVHFYNAQKQPVAPPGR